MGGFGYLGQQSATCSACGRRIPNEDEPGIVWAVSLDGMSFDPFCESCVARKGLRVHERVNPSPNPYRPRGLTCSRCGIDLPGPEDGGWVLLVDDEDGRLEGICNGCRVAEQRETRLALRPRDENEEDTDEEGRPGMPREAVKVVPRGDRKEGHLVIGLIADTHGVLDRQVLEVFAGVDHIVHAGDLDEPGVLDRLAKVAPVTAVRGNSDYGSWADELPEEALLSAAGLSVLVAHHGDIALATPSLCEGVDVLVCGHTQIPDAVLADDVLALNPGSPSYPRGYSSRSIALLYIDAGKVAGVDFRDPATEGGRLTEVADAGRSSPP
jgi:uncharacterized protein